MAGLLTTDALFGANVPQGLALYHPASALGSREGYYPSISTIQHSAVLKLRDSLLTTNGTNAPLYERFHHDEENEYLKMLRFLRARKFDVDKALKLIQSDVEWRTDKLQLRTLTSVDVLGCDSQAMYAYFPTWMHGYDKQQRPVSYRQFGAFEISKVLKLTTMEKLIRFHAWETEQAVRKALEQSKATGNNIETFVLVVDAAGWSLRLATSDAFTFIKGMASTDSDHYPERLGCMILINAPSVLSFAWRVIQTFLDDVTKAKIKIMGSDPKEWQPVLFDLVDPDHVPEMYGGKAPNPTAENAFATMDPAPEALVASDQQAHKAHGTFNPGKESAQKPDSESLDLLPPPASELQNTCASDSESGEVRPPVPPPL